MIILHSYFIITVVNNSVCAKSKALGCQYFTVIYQFMCLGSCLGGPSTLVISLLSSSGKALLKVGPRKKFKCSTPSCDNDS